MRAHGVPMLPVVAGRDETQRQIVIYSVVLLPPGVAPWFLGYAGAIYGVDRAHRRRRHGCAGVAHLDGMRQGERADEAAKQLFAFSILYLFVLFAVLLVEAGFGVGA